MGVTSRQAIVLGVLLMAATTVVVMACGGGEEDGGQEAELQALLEKMVLREEDLPAGLQRVEASFSTNAEEAERAADPQAKLEELLRWGRRLGHVVTFLVGPDASADLSILGLQNAVSLYLTEGGARDSLAEDIERARAADWAKQYPNLQQLEVTEIQRPDLADRLFWMRITGLEGEALRLSVEDQVAFSLGPVRGFLRVQSLFPAGTSRDTYIDQVEDWLRLLADRITLALQERSSGAADS